MWKIRENCKNVEKCEQLKMCEYIYVSKRVLLKWNVAKCLEKCKKWKNMLKCVKTLKKCILNCEIC